MCVLWYCTCVKVHTKNVSGTTSLIHTALFGFDFSYKMSIIQSEHMHKNLLRHSGMSVSYKNKCFRIQPV